MNTLRQAINHWLDTMFAGSLPYDQPSGTALAAALTLGLAPSGVRSPVLYGAPKKAATKELLAKRGIAFEPREWMVDFVMMDRRSATRRVPLVACESEMHPNHGTGYSFEIWHDPQGRPYPQDGYAWDFCKLLHFPAPRLLFTARLPASRIAELETSLNQCAEEYRDLWATRQLNVVLIPSGTSRRSLVRVGASSTNGDLCFESLSS